MLGMTALALAALPATIPMLAVADLVRFRPRLPSVRVYLFALQYLVNDSVEILAAGPYWMAAGFGTRLRSRSSIERHRRLQQWSLDLLERRAEQLLGLRIDMALEDHSALVGTGSGPVIVVSRHVSLFDASLPGILAHRAGYSTRGVIMAELLADPGFDLLYGRLGSVFIPRDGGSAAIDAIADMVRDADERTAYLLFPEGRLFRTGALTRSLDRLAAADPERAKRLAGLTRVLPPRPGGLVTLLAAVPTADVVVLDHRGLDGVGRLGDLARSVPRREPISVTARRITRSEIPTDPAAQAHWLDDLWLGLDRDLSREPDRDLSPDPNPGLDGRH